MKKSFFTSLKCFSKRAQMEMIGLAFIVVFMILGLLFYVAFSTTTTISPAIRESSLYGKALQTSMLETTIPDCGYDLAAALDRCITQPHLFCRTKNVCDATNDAFFDMLDSTLGENNIPYFAYVEHEGGLLEEFESDAGCVDVTNRYSAPSQPIHTNAGDLRFIIEFC